MHSGVTEKASGESRTSQGIRNAAIIIRRGKECFELTEGILRGRPDFR